MPSASCLSSNAGPIGGVCCDTRRAHPISSAFWFICNTGPTQGHRDNIPSEKQWAHPIPSAIWLSRSTGPIQCDRQHGSAGPHGPFSTIDRSSLRNIGPTPYHQQYDPAPTLGPFKVIDHVSCEQRWAHPMLSES